MRSVQCNPDASLVATVGLDRRLRVHSVTRRVLRADVYLKQRLSCVLFGESVKPVLKRKAVDDDEDASGDDGDAESSGGDTDSVFDALERADDVSPVGSDADFSVDDSEDSDGDSSDGDSDDDSDGSDDDGGDGDSDADQPAPVVAPKRRKQ